MSLPSSRRIGQAAIGVLALAVAAPALAADLDYQPYPGIEPGPSNTYREERVEEELPPPRPAFVEPRFAAGPHFGPRPVEECRTIVKRRIDPDGEEIERRVRICDDVPVARQRPYFRPSFYRPRPVPPADLPDGPWDGPPPRW